MCVLHLQRCHVERPRSTKACRPICNVLASGGDSFVVSVCRVFKQPAMNYRRSDRYARWIDRRRHAILAVGGLLAAAGAALALSTSVARRFVEPVAAAGALGPRPANASSVAPRRWAWCWSRCPAPTPRAGAWPRARWPRASAPLIPRAGRRRGQRRGRRAALRLGPSLSVRAARGSRVSARRAPRHDPAREAARQSAVRIA